MFLFLFILFIICIATGVISVLFYKDQLKLEWYLTKISLEPDNKDYKIHCLRLIYKIPLQKFKYISYQLVSDILDDDFRNYEAQLIKASICLDLHLFNEALSILMNINPDAQDVHTNEILLKLYIKKYKTIEEDKDANLNQAFHIYKKLSAISTNKKKYNKYYKIFKSNMLL